MKLKLVSQLCTLGASALGVGTVSLVAVMGFAPAGIAQEIIGQQSSIPPITPVPYEQVSDTFNRVLSTHSSDFYGNLTIWRQTDFLFGLGEPITGTYRENELAEDGRNTNMLYREIMNQMVSTTPLIRTRDLNNPYGQSLSSLPNQGFGFSGQVPGSEFVSDGLMPR